MIIITYVVETFSDPELPVSHFRLRKSENSFLKILGFLVPKVPKTELSKSFMILNNWNDRVIAMKEKEVQEICSLFFVRNEIFCILINGQISGSAE